jgi:hypothetical protein
LALVLTSLLNANEWDAAETSAIMAVRAFEGKKEEGRWRKGGRRREGGGREEGGRNAG